MQRKSRILNNRDGFAMITAIFFMIIMATLLTYMLSSTAETAEKTTKAYLNEQAQLLAKSAVEYAILQVSSVDRTAAGCLKFVSAVYPDNTNPLFNIQVDIAYHGFGTGCTGNGTASSVTTSESNGTMLIDVYVEDDASLNLDEPVRYHRRTLQKL